MNQIEHIESFGSEDAENDQNLIDYFYISDVITQINNYKKSLVLGRKGTGKTAIYKYLLKKNINVANLTFSSYPWRIHDNFENKLLSEREAYKQSWLFFFYIELFKLICKNKNAYQYKTKKEINHLEKWIIRNYGSITFNYKQTLVPKKKHFKFVFEPSIFGNSLGSISKEIESSVNIGETLDSFIEKFDKILSSLINAENINYYLLFDELDIAYNDTDENYVNRLIGLLLAEYHFFYKYRKNIHVFVFLRNDIFNILEFQDKRKIRDGISIFLDWDPDHVDDQLSLKQIAAKRIQSVLHSESDNFEKNWSAVFDNATIYKNHSNWKYFIDRSFIRPRDLIKFMNLSLEKAKQRLRTNPNSIDLITNEDIREMQKDYSNYLYSEIKDETCAKYPDFDKYLEILRNLHKISFNKMEFEEHYKKINERYKSLPEKEDVLKRLFEFGIIGFYKPGGGGYGGSEYCYQFRSEMQPFNPAAEKYKTHLGFKEYLELIE